MQQIDWIIERMSKQIARGELRREGLRHGGAEDPIWDEEKAQKSNDQGFTDDDKDNLPSNITFTPASD